MSNSSLHSIMGDVVSHINIKCYYALRYWHQRGRFPNFKKPSDLSEYLLAEQLKPDFKRFAPFADKIQVREYIKRKGFSDILPKIYQVVKDAHQLDFDALPDRFVLKTNHGCGGHIFCTDKRLLNKKDTIEKLNKTAKTVYSIQEPHYQYIEPLIYAEEFIQDKTSGNSLPIDYKFMMSGGKRNPVMACILVICDRQTTLKMFCRDPHWNDISQTWLNPPSPINKKTYTGIKKPENLDRMVDIAQKIGEDFEFVRVDLYDTGNAVYFSELTFSPAGGYFPYFTDFALKELYKPIAASRMECL